MIIPFPYNWCPDLQIDDRLIQGIYAPKEVCLGLEQQQRIIKIAMDNPIGTPRLSEMAKGKRRLVIITDDNTRNTPIPLLLSAVLDELSIAGISDDQVGIVIAYGTHRAMTTEEKRIKLGDDVVDRFRIVDHDSRDKSSMTSVGHTDTGIDILISSEVINADLVIALGHIVPHRVAGWSGGGKAIQPGVSGEDITGHTHWASSFFDSREILGVADNPVRREVERVASVAGLGFILNVIMAAVDQIAACVAGDPVLAHRAGSVIGRQILGVKIPREADVVICDSYPADLDFWQANKALFAADIAARQGGAVILITPCPEGVSSRHPQLLDYGYMSFAEVQSLVEAGALTDLTLAANLSGVGRVVAEHVTCIVVSPWLRAVECEKLGMRHADTPQEALQMALDIVRRGGGHNNPIVSVLRRAPEILPLIG